MRNHDDGYYDRVCPECGNSFSTFYAWQKYCNKNCQLTANAFTYYHTGSYKRVANKERQQQYMVIRDPDEYGLLPGCMLSKDDVRECLEHASFTQGMTIRHRKKNIDYVVSGKKLVMV
jgi:hypothetical protein